MTVQTALQQGSRLLEDAGVAEPRLTAEVLLCHALGRERAYLYSHPEADLEDAARIHYGRSLRERLQGKPTQYITRRQEFYGREFTVSPDVLIPRPETEHVVEAALALRGSVHRVVDVGCGSGAIAVTLRLEMGCQVWGTDVSAAALKVAAANAARLNAPVRFVACDLASAFGARTMDLVVSNPPYVALTDGPGLQREVREWEPHVALFAGETGLEIYARVVAEAERVLRPGGALIVELGFKTHDRVRAMLGASWQDVRMAPDLAGIPRVLVARLE
ncbi:MAG TPA: peptide chain release factor N(5)-glutamine methyltransferase [Bryobacteraceae bacterium]|nr:peptide chain release factor N(5)-glutamine methyltransferase [Bryobacteraceae bacterium]